MPETTGQVAAQNRATETTMQTAYRAFIVHTQQCTPCRTDGVDCAEAETLRQTYRDATPPRAKACGTGTRATTTTGTRSEHFQSHP